MKTYQVKHKQPFTKENIFSVDLLNETELNTLKETGKFKMKGTFGKLIRSEDIITINQNN